MIDVSMAHFRTDAGMLKMGKLTRGPLVLYYLPKY